MFENSWDFAKCIFQAVTLRVYIGFLAKFELHAGTSNKSRLKIMLI